MRANQRVPFICRESKKGVLPGSGKFGAPDMEIQRPAIGPAALSRPGPLEFLTHYSLLAECYAGAPHAPVFPSAPESRTVDSSHRRFPPPVANF
jgi:hypothetical protein